MGLPRGVVSVASEVAARLVAPLDVIVVRKVGWSESSELGLGAVDEAVMLETLLAFRERQ